MMILSIPDLVGLEEKGHHQRMWCSDFNSIMHSVAAQTETHVLDKAYNQTRTHTLTYTDIPQRTERHEMRN